MISLLVDGEYAGGCETVPRLPSRNGVWEQD